MHRPVNLHIVLWLTEPVNTILFSNKQRVVDSIFLLTKIATKNKVVKQNAVYSVSEMNLEYSMMHMTIMTKLDRDDKVPFFS